VHVSNERKTTEVELLAENTALKRRIAELESQVKVEPLVGSELTLRSITDHCPSPVSIKDLDHRFRFVNKAFETMFEKSFEQVVGRTSSVTVSGEQAAFVHALERRVIESGEVRAEERVQTLSNGELLHTIVTKFPIKNANGEPALVGSITTDISEVKKAEAALRDSEKQLRLITDTLPVLIASLDADLRYQMINETGAKWYGRAAAEIIGKRPIDFFGSQQEVWRDHIENALRGNEVRYEQAMTYPDGVTRDVRVIYTPDKDVNGDVRGIFSLIEDISEQKNSEAAARASELRFKDFAAASSDWYWEMDADLRYTQVDKRFDRISGSKAERRIGKHRWDFDGSKGETEFWKAHRDDLAARRPFRNLEYSRRIDENREVFVSTSGVPVFDEAGEFAGYRGSVTDITERKLAEIAIQESKNRFMALIDSVPAGITLKDRDGRYLLVNETYGDWVGVSPAHIVGNFPHDYIPPEQADQINFHDYKVFETGENDVHEGVRSFREGGQTLSVLTSKAPVYAADGSISAVASIILDTTEQKQLEGQLRQAQRMEAVGQLTGGVAHDFNNLLFVMLGNAELLEFAVGEEKTAQKHLDAIKLAVKRASSLTQRLLAFSRQQALSPVSADVSDLIGGLEEMLRRTLGEMVVLSVEPGSDLWLATIDPHQFENAVVNLAINARDAMPDGGGLTIKTANVTLDKAYAWPHEEVTPGDYVRVEVIDTGVGIAPEDLTKVFEPFFTTKDVGEGSGLGLSMVYGFVKQSEGHTTIESDVDQGTKITLYLPRALALFDRDVVADDAPEFSQGAERILIVEDDANVRQVPVEILSSQGYEVTEAQNGEEAIARVSEGETFDLLFTDILLPGGMNGVEIAEKVKRLQPGIKVLYTTGYAENAVIRKGLLDPDVVLLHKPYLRTELLEKIKHTLDDDAN
jgi:PAS domain S-box-containing protein